MVLLYVRLLSSLWLPASLCSPSPTLARQPATAGIHGDSAVSTSFSSQLVANARKYLGVRERGGANRGAEVERFLRAVGLGPGYPWCGAFVGLNEKECGIRNPKPSARARGYKTKESVRAWDVAIGRVKIQPGYIFVMEFGSWTGHTGIVESYDPKTRTLTTIEGNTNGAGSREGDRVARKQRKIYANGNLKWLTPTDEHKQSKHALADPDSFSRGLRWMVALLDNLSSSSGTSNSNDGSRSSPNRTDNRHSDRPARRAGDALRESEIERRQRITCRYYDRSPTYPFET